MGLARYTFQLMTWQLNEGLLDEYTLCTEFIDALDKMNTKIRGDKGMQDRYVYLFVFLILPT